MVKDLELIVEKLRSDAKEGRSLKYEEGEIGITALLYCPHKVEMRKMFPEIESRSVSIDDGYRFERDVKKVCKELFGEGRVYEEFELVYKKFAPKVKLRGHLDVVIEKNDKVIGIEVKVPQVINLRSFPEMKKEIIIDNEIEEKHLIVAPTYKLQAKIEKFLLEQIFDKQVHVYLFQAGVCRFGKGFIKKFYTFYEVLPITKEELDQLILRFLNEKKPRFINECEGYCPYGEVGVCSFREVLRGEVSAKEIEDFEKKIFDPTNPKIIDPMIKEAYKLYKDYLDLKTQAEQIKKKLSQVLVEPVYFLNKEIGWIDYEEITYDIDVIVNALKQRDIPLGDYLNVSFSPRKRRYIESTIPDAVLSKEVKKKFKI